jgi:triacylglycerol lipase
MVAPSCNKEESRVHTATRARRLLVAACLSVAAFGAVPTMAAAANDPVVFVHGWNSSGSVWNTMISRLSTEGWTSAQLNNWSYNTSQSNATTASQLSTKINQVLAATGASKVDVVTHSMGALSSRYYLKNLGGAAKVDHWVSLGGPNHGTNTANLCLQTSCSEMRVGSSFLAALNSGDETPGSTIYRTWWSACDSVINPDSSVSLIGATNTQTACIGHNSLYSDATVHGQVRDFIAP